MGSTHELEVTERWVDDASSRNNSTAKPVLQKLPWYAYIWDYDPERSVEERRLVRRLDCTLLVILSLGIFIQHLDQRNIAHTYVSGMKEKLNMTGDDINYLDIAYTAGMVLGQIPSQLILNRVRPTFWLPCCEIIWSLLTLSLAALTSWKQFIGMRFCIGLVEAGYLPGAIALLGTWYKPAELGKRITIFGVAGVSSAIFAGLLIAGLYSGLDGVRGLDGWRWMFIFDGLIGLPVGVATYFLLPDLPENSKAFYLSPEQRELAQERMTQVGRAPRGKLDRTVWKRVFGRWHVWCLVPIHMIMTNHRPSTSINPFALWLKWQGYSVEKINLIPTSAAIVPLVTSWVCSTLSDALRHRALFMVGLAFFGIVPMSLLAAWNIPTPLKWFAWETMHVDAAAGPIFMAWANEICGGDAEERFLVLGIMNTVAGAIAIWLPLFTWPASEAPTFHTGFCLAAICHAAEVLAVLWIWQRSKKEARRNTLQ